MSRNGQSGSLEETSVLSPSTGEELERGDDIPVLACENGVWTGGHETKPKRSQYAVRPRLSCRRLPARCREVSVLATGILLTCIALGLIVAGASRLQDCQKVTLLKVGLKHPLGENGFDDFGDEKFSLEQLVLLNNYAFQRPALQSSTAETTRFSPEVDGVADLAVDGSLDTCSRTDKERLPHWQVDLGRLEPIRSVRILSSNFSRMEDFEVFVGTNRDMRTNRLCYRHHGRSNSTDIRVVCKELLSGSHVGIALHPTRQEFQDLVLCEVMVFGR